LLGGDLEAVGLQRVGEALAAVLRQRQRRDALDLDDDRVGDALVLELLADVVAGGDAHAVVVAADPRPVRQVVGEDAVEVDDRDAGVHGLAADLVQLLAVVGEDHQHVDLRLDQRLDGGDLLVDVVGRFDRLERHVGVLLGLLLGVLGYRRDPAVVRGGRGEPDGDLLAGLVVVAGERAGLGVPAAGVAVLGVAGAGRGEAAGRQGGASEQEVPAAGTGTLLTGALFTHDVLLVEGVGGEGGVRWASGARGAAAARRRR